MTTSDKPAQPASSSASTSGAAAPAKTAEKAAESTKSAATTATATAKKTANAAKTTATKTTKAAASTAKKTTKKATTAAKRTTRTAKKTADNVVSINKNVASKAASKASENAQEIQQKMAEASMENAQQFAKQADVMSRIVNESFASSRDHAEAYVEAGKVAAECANDISEKMISYANDSIAENVEISKDFFACRTASDVFELQNRLTQTNVERFLSETSEISDMLFSMFNRASEPVSERIAETTERVMKAAIK